MNKQLANIEPIPLPDRRKPGTMPSLPAWLEHCSAAVKIELQPTAEGFRDVDTLPPSLIPTGEQRQAIKEHIDSLLSYLQETPAESDEAQTQIASAVTSLQLVLPSARKSELGAEARADVYLEVLDDVPWWAVKAAIKRWHRHDCGADERGQPYDYRWAPDAGTLRRVAHGEIWQIKQRIRDLEKVLDARKFIECSKELEFGRSAMRGLKIGLKFGDARQMTFAQAVERGQEEATNDHAEGPNERDFG
jgi:hypothetical protein